MNFKLQTPMLQRVAQVKIVAHLWNQHDIWTQIAKSNCNLPYGARRDKSKEWKEVEVQVMEKVLALPLPEPFKKHLLNFIKPLGIEVINWCRCHYEEGRYFDIFLNHLPKRFSWTFRGTVDYKKTAELMAKDEELDIEIRYKIACINCIEDEIRKLYKHLHEDRRKELQNDVRAHNSKIYPHDWMVFWACTINDTMDNMFMQRHYVQDIFSYVEIFMYAARSGNRTACMYLFEKLNEKEKNEILVEFQWLISRNLITVVLYVWPQMGEETQKNLFQMCAGEAILCFLCWPYQSLFLETAKRMCCYMNKDHFNAVLCALTEKIRKGFKDYNYVELFLQFWHLIIPTNHKKYFVNHRNFVIRLFATKEEELIKWVLHELSALQFQQLLYSEDAFIRGTLLDESIVSHSTLNGWRRQINLNLMNERDEENQCNCEHLLRLIDSLVDSRV